MTVDPFEGRDQNPFGSRCRPCRICGRMPEPDFRLSGPMRFRLCCSKMPDYMADGFDPETCVSDWDCHAVSTDWCDTMEEAERQWNERYGTEAGE